MSAILRLRPPRHQTPICRLGPTPDSRIAARNVRGLQHGTQKLRLWLRFWTRAQLAFSVGDDTASRGNLAANKSKLIIVFSLHPRENSLQFSSPISGIV